RAKTEEARNKCFDRLNQGVNRATRLVEQLLTLTRLDPDSTKQPYEIIQLDQLVKSVCEDMTPIAEQKNIRISVSTETTATAGMEDAIRLMITNLTDNAIRYTQNGGRIELKTFSKSNQAIISISDNGPGIPQKDRIRVFDRFYRSLGTKTAGTGLGLAIVKRIIDLHHGSIQISEGLNGQGTCFKITLPKSDIT
ncbi:integral membrane sensor signal transduction histidine kinase, partial [gut metagenome]